MIATLSRFTAALSHAPKPQDRYLLLRRLPLFLCLALGLSGCQAHSVAPTTPLTPARSLAGSSAAIGKVQSSLLYQQARRDCTAHDYLHAATLLQELAQTPGLAPDAVAYVERQRQLCLADAHVSSVKISPVPSTPAPSPTDADCGPRALLLVCQQLGVKTTLTQLRQSAGTTAEGTTLAGLQQAAQRLGLKAEGVQVSREALSDVTPLAIAWDRKRHFLVVESLNGRGDGGTARIHDPNRAEAETVSQESLLQRSGGILLLVHR